MCARVCLCVRVCVRVYLSLPASFPSIWLCEKCCACSTVHCNKNQSQPRQLHCRILLKAPPTFKREIAAFERLSFLLPCSSPSSLLLTRSFLLFFLLLLFFRRRRRGRGGGQRTRAAPTVQPFSCCSCLSQSRCCFWAPSTVTWAQRVRVRACAWCRSVLSKKKT